MMSQPSSTGAVPSVPPVAGPPGPPVAPAPSVAGPPAPPVAPVPTRRTLWARRSLPVQLYRFARINLRMARMVRRSHQG